MIQENEKENWVPKVDPRTRGIEAEDPLELVATPVDGDPDLMLECMIEEFLWIGSDADELLAMFRSPNYPVLNQLLDYYGEGAIRNRIEAFLTRTSGIRIHQTISEEDSDDQDSVPDLLQVSTAKLRRGPAAMER